MKLPLIDPFLQNFHKNLSSDPLLKHEADELIECIEYDKFNEFNVIRIQFLEKIDFNELYNKNRFDHTFQKKYHLYINDPDEYMELTFENPKIVLYENADKELKFKEIINSSHILDDIKLINKLFGTGFKYVDKFRI